jgi:hypothetical protein
VGVCRRVFNRQLFRRFAERIPFQKQQKQLVLARRETGELFRFSSSDIPCFPSKGCRSPALAELSGTAGVSSSFWFFESIRFFNRFNSAIFSPPYNEI